MFRHVVFSYAFQEVLTMDVFTMEIAGVAVCVYPLFASTKEYCRPFLTQIEPELEIRITWEDLPVEQGRLEQEAIEEGLKIRKFQDPFLERSIIQRRIADYLIGKDILLLHGSTVAVDNNAYLFTAPCGTGKSTHTRLWREYFGQHAIMVNDDKLFIKITSSGAVGYGSPWSGKHGLGSNVCVPLAGICSLTRGPENRIWSAEREPFLEILNRQVHIPHDVSQLDHLQELISKLADLVPMWQMECNKELEAARVSHSAMSGHDI